jgi:guanylate kinase
MERKGLIYVISAPSGAGKTSLCNELLAARPGLQLSVSYTTRAMREGEKNGIDYHFVSVETFEEMIERMAFVEWAKVHDNYYGTSLETLEQASRAGQDILLDIDCQGAAQLREKLDNGVYIFILPPDYDELQNRLEKRNTDAAEVVQRRVENARDEVAEAGNYDYIVVNDNFDFALQQLKAILSAEPCRTRFVLPAIQDKFQIT